MVRKVHLNIADKYSRENGYRPNLMCRAGGDDREMTDLFTEVTCKSCRNQILCSFQHQWHTTWSILRQTVEGAWGIEFEVGTDLTKVKGVA